ncbi:hypothetical protein UK82_22665 [Frankia sp. ACN1ag]|nr:hypothetical protein UK82_22665 [Frankia sp. ACN1ag]
MFGRSVDDLSDDECLHMDGRIARELARLEAWRLRVRARFARLRPPLAGDREGAERGFSEFAGDEIAAVARSAPAAAGRQLELAVAVVDRLPETLAALESGEIDLDRVRAMADVTKSLDVSQARTVENRVLARGARASCPSFRAAVTRSVLAVDPDGADQRRRRRERDRHVRTRAKEDGMGELSALLPADRMVAVYRRIDALARDAGGPDDERSIGERRADVLVDLVMGERHGPVATEVSVVVSLATLMGLSTAPGELEGYGPIPAELARELAHGSRSSWRRIVTDPIDGSVLDVGDRRHPSPAMARFVRARDRTCVFPGCLKPARDCDLDHTTSRAEGGKTRVDNTDPLCRHHHRLKHAGIWILSQPVPGHHVWTSQTGHQFVSEPEPYLDEVV